MVQLLRLLCGVLIGVFQSSARREAEILVLRQQINVLRRKSRQRDGPQQLRSSVVRLAASAGSDDASAPLHHSLSLAGFITNIAESSFQHTHPIDSSDTHQIQRMRRSSVRQERCAHTMKNRTEVQCPRVTQAAMIAAASFGLRRSGTFATTTSGAAYWAA
jgi:hypothetical protein